MPDYVFDSATALTPRGQGRFDARLGEQWTIGAVPNGGYVMAIGLRAARETSQHQDPLTTTAHFLSPTAAGPVEVVCEVVKPGRSTTTVMTSILEEGRERVRMLTTLGDLDSRRGHSHSRLAAPVLEGPFERRRSPLMDGFPTNFEFSIPQAVAGGVVGEPTGVPEIGGTIAFADGRPPDLLALPVFADGLPPVAFNLGYVGWTPTLELTVHFWNHPAPGPVTVWIRTDIAEGGFHDESAELWDSEGTLVARSRQLAVILSPGTPEGG